MPLRERPSIGRRIEASPRTRTGLDVDLDLDAPGAPIQAGLASLVCVGCGCSEYRACAGGCSWVSYDPPVCDNCVGGL